MKSVFEEYLIVFLYVLVIIGMLADVRYALDYAVELYRTARTSVEGLLIIISALIPGVNVIVGWGLIAYEILNIPL